MMGGEEEVKGVSGWMDGWIRGFVWSRRQYQDVNYVGPVRQAVRTQDSGQSGRWSGLVWATLE